MPKTIGRYEILEEIGRGSMGVVYKANDPRIGRVVALKTIAFSFPLGPGEEEEFLQRFYHEAQIAGRLNHPNIVTIYDVGEKGAEGDAYIAMEHVTGTNLHELLAGGGRLPLAQIVEVIGQLSQALDYAHQNGVVHRDIKPANIVLTEAGQAKILDFGIARLAAGGMTRPGKFFGTPNYMAPEQVTGVDVDGRADQFSLAVILYQLLTGEKPFVGDSVTAISYQVVHVDPPPPSKLNPSLGPPFDRIIRKALAKSVSDRFPRCQDLSEELRTAVAGWKEAADLATPPTLVSGREPQERVPEAMRQGGVKGITFLAPRWSRLLLREGSPLNLGWVVFLLCLALVAFAPYLVYRSSARGGSRSQPFGLVTAGAGEPARPAQPAPVDPATAARLNVSLTHRFATARVVIRIDGEQALDEPIRGRGTRSRWSRTVQVSPGSHRVEVRVSSGDGTFDDIEGIEAVFRSKERKDLRLTLSSISKRIKMRFEEPAPARRAR